MFSIPYISECDKDFNLSRAEGMWHMKRALLLEYWSEMDVDERQELVKELVEARYGKFGDFEMYKTLEELKKTDIYKYMKAESGDGELP